MSTLLVDLGNSRLKWARFDNSGLHDSSSLTHRAQNLSALLSTHWRELEDIQRVFVSCVANKSIREHFEGWLVQHLDCQPEFLISPARGSGLVNSYTEPNRLGPDRWAAMVAARRQSDGAFAVVDCGSAVTIDMVDETGQHLGGMIVPGIHAMLESLAKNTPLRVHELEKIDEVRLGTSTQAAVQAGILGAIACLVNQRIPALISSANAGMRCLLTGGDAQYIAPLLNIPFEHQANLVLKGLAILADEIS